MVHDRAWLRAKSWHKAIRKRNLDRELTPFCTVHFYDNLHQYSKNKIHCSCGMCSAKTRNKGNRRTKHGNYAPSINWCIRDRKAIESYNSQMEELDI